MGCLGKVGMVAGARTVWPWGRVSVGGVEGMGVSWLGQVPQLFRVL